jgi:hypothetical protein
MSDEKDSEIKKVAVEEKIPENVTPLALVWLFLKLAFTSHLGKTITLLVTCLVVYQFYANNTNIFAVIREGRATLSSNAPPTLDPSKFSDIAQSLTKAGAKSVAIYDVDLGGVQRTLVYATMDGEPEKNFVGDKDSLYARLGVRDHDDDRLRKGRYNEIVFKLQNGDFVCDNLEPTTRYGAYLLKNEVKYTCAIGLPTGLTKFFIGSIVVGFDGEFDSSQEDFMRSSLYQSGQDILIK